MLEGIIPISKDQHANLSRKLDKNKIFPLHTSELHHSGFMRQSARDPLVYHACDIN